MAHSVVISRLRF